MTFIPAFRAPFTAPFPAATTAAAVAWYLSGGVTAGQCVAAYQAKGAASLAASYVNLNTPGTYDAAPGTAPTWDGTNGWQFLSTSSQYLKTGYTPARTQARAMIIRFSNYSGTGLACGFYNDSAAEYFFIRPSATSYANGAVKIVAPGMTSGVLAVAGNVAYRNGLAESGSIADLAGTPLPVMIGAVSYPGSTQAFYATVYIQAFAVYNITLTPAQALAITTAMQAL